MEKLFYSVLLVIISVFIISCGNHFFNPKYYYSKKNGNTSTSGGNFEPPPPPEELPEGMEDPFEKGEWNKPDYGGYNGNKFDSWLFEASFRGDKLPIYNFKEPGGKNWISGGKDWKDNLGDYYLPVIGDNKVYDAPVVGTISIDPLKIYKYNGNNPLYGISGYLPGRLDRFNFYSIDGKASIKLQQYLIAVDKYSKLIFAYGKITSTGNLFGNVYPTDFDAIERYGKKIPFYEYDPIGYVDSTGKVILYEHYETEFVKNPTGYMPSQHGFAAIAEHSKSKPGKSPYVPLKTDADNIIIMAKSLKNISVKSRSAIFGFMGNPLNNAWFTYTIAGTAYNNETGGVLENIENLDPRSQSATGMIYLSETKDIKVNAQINFSSSITNEVRSIDKGATIELASRVDKYNKETGFADTAKFGQHGSGNMAAVSAPILKLKYDADNKCFVVDTQNSVMKNDRLSTTISYYTPDFTLKRGETKDITIRYKWMKGNDTSNGEEFEITYTLKFEAVK